MNTKHPSDSKTTVTDLVLPSETNAIHTLFGGELLARMDRAASITAQRHSERIVVTASVNHVAFNHAIPLGSIVTIEAKMRKERKEAIYAAEERKQAIIEWAVGLALGTVAVAVMVFVFWIIGKSQGKW